MTAHVWGIYHARVCTHKRPVTGVYLHARNATPWRAGPTNQTSLQVTFPAVSSSLTPKT